MATKTFDELKQLAIQIRDEKTNKQNTANRVGTAMLEGINKLEQDFYDKIAADEEFKKRDDKLIELANNVGLYNVDKHVPLGGGFYTSATARAAVPSDVRKIGLIITYKTDVTTSVTEQFIGSDVSGWTTDANWKNVGSEGGNKILEWKTDAATTRKKVPVKERKAGMQISYKPTDSDWVNEQYVGTSFTDTEWVKDSNWEKIPKQKQLTELFYNVDNKILNLNYIRTDNLVNSIQLEFWEYKSFGNEGYEVRYLISLDKSKIYMASPYITNGNVASVQVYAVDSSDELINQSYYIALSTSNSVKIDFTSKSYYSEIKNLVLVVKCKANYGIDIEKDIPSLKIMISEGTEEKEYVDYLLPYSSEEIKNDIQTNKKEINEQKESVEKIPTIEKAVKVYNISKYEVGTSANGKLYDSDTSPAYFDEEFLNGVKKVTGIKIYTWGTEADFKVYAITLVSTKKS